MAHADPAADWPAVLLASDATVELQSSAGTRRIAITDFFTGFYATALEEGEIITALKIPKTASNAHSAYAKFKQPASRFAIVGCAAGVEMNGGTVSSARVALTGVGEHAFRVNGVEAALAGKALSADNIDQALQGLTDDIFILSDHYASEKYRAHLAKVFTKRALLSLA